MMNDRDKELILLFANKNGRGCDAVKLTIVGQWGGFPKRGGASSGYLLEHDGYRLLLDCGSAVLSKLQNYVHVINIDAVILSHYHTDHIADIGVLQHAIMIESLVQEQTFTIPIYGHTREMQAFQKLTYKDYTVAKEYDVNEQLQIGPFTIEWIETLHSVPCFAMRIMVDGKVLVYTGDTAYFEQLADFSENADVLLSECNFYKGMDGAKAGHMTSEDVGIVAQTARVKQVVLTHLPHFGEVQQLISEVKEQYDGHVLLAEEGLTIEI